MGSWRKPPNGSTRRCYRCQELFSAYELDHGLLQFVEVEKVQHDFHVRCTELILHEWIIRKEEIALLKTS